MAEVNKLFSQRVGVDVVVAVIKHRDTPLCRTLTVEPLAHIERRRI